MSDTFENNENNINFDSEPDDSPTPYPSPETPSPQNIDHTPVIGTTNISDNPYATPDIPDDTDRSPMYKISPAEAPDWSTYTPPSLEDRTPFEGKPPFGDGPSGPLFDEGSSSEDFESEADEDEGSGWQTAWTIIREVGETIILTLIIFFVIQAFVRNFRVVGTSMVGNLQDGQYLIVDKVSYNGFVMDTLGWGGPDRGDVVVFEPPNRPDDDYVKRVIGLPGETVEIVRGQVFINGEPLDETFEPVQGTYSTPLQTVPEGQVFVLGDNRNNSNDSHTWGPLPIENIIGRAWLSYWPPASWGTIPNDVPTSEATLKAFIDNFVPDANAESP